MMFDMASIYRKANFAEGRGSTQYSQDIEDNNDHVVWTNRNLKYMFTRIFEVAIDLPISM